MADAPPLEPRPWQRAAGWLLVLGMFFFSSYGFANWLASLRTPVPEIVFGWERHIPFLAWTIVAYWSIDFFYALSLFLCRTKTELDTHAKRLLAAQIIAVSCFIATPLQNSFARPPVEAPFSWLYDALMQFDRPFNQAPALHIALLIVLRELYVKVLPGACRPLVNLAGLVIALSVLTTGQHHFIDVATGAWLGWFCVWLFPDDRPSRIATASLSRDPLRRALAVRYAFAGLALVVVSVALSGMWLWLMWIAGALGLVAVTYAFLDEFAFQKLPGGSLAPFARWLFAPYTVGAWINSRLWTRALPRSTAVTPDVSLGRLPTVKEYAALGSPAIVDVCAELPFHAQSGRYASVPMLDLVSPRVDQLEGASRAIVAAANNGSVLVCCALGLSRSALACAAWLLRSGQARSPDDALQRVRTAQPAAVFHLRHREVLIEWFTWQQFSKNDESDTKRPQCFASGNRSAA